jgi:hypothetical protein
LVVPPLNSTLPPPEIVPLTFLIAVAAELEDRSPLTEKAPVFELVPAVERTRLPRLDLDLPGFVFVRTTL